MVLQTVLARWRSLLSLGLVLWLSWGGIAPAWALPAEATTDKVQRIQPYLDRVASAITEFTLDNGLRFIVLERHRAPVVSFITYADVGAVDEVDGKTGVAHYLEHLAFKGTTRIGTTDYRAEQPLFEQMDAVFQQLKAARTAGNTAQATTLQAQLAALQAEAATYVVQNQFGQIVEQAGGVGLNATTGADATRYFYSFPANKLELWMSLEADRFSDPVWREFFEEKNVILEERQMRVDNSPIGTMVETFLETAFTRHPYRRPVIGYEADLFNASRDDIQTFFDRHYGPSNLIIGIVGDVDPDVVQAMATAYFGPLPARPPAPPLTVSEPPQTAPREFTLELPAQPWYLEGYHRPAGNHPDDPVYSIIDGILTGGRTSRFYKTLVEDQQLLLDAASINGFPGDKYENILLFYGLTAPNHTVDEAAIAIQAELARLCTELVQPTELERVKTNARAGLLQVLDSNQGMASLLVEYEAKTGDWRNLFQELDAIEAVTAEDVQRVAQATFRPENRIVGRLLSTSGG